MINVRFPSSFKGSFNKKLEVHRSDLYKIAWSWCHDAALADDLVQETFAKALKNRTQLKEMVKLKPWLTRVLANLHNDHLRSKLQLKQQFSFKDELAITDQDPSNMASRDQSVQHVRNAIAQLNDKHRKIVTLVDIAEYTYADVAEILEIPVGTVMSRLNRARDQLKTLLSDMDKPHEEISSPSNFLKIVK